MFYLMTHSTHFIYCYILIDIWKEGNGLFNDTLNTFYLLLYPRRHFIYGYMFIDTAVVTSWDTFSD